MENTTVPAGTIVVGVDGSAGSARALQWAIEQSRLDHRALTLVHSNGPAHVSWADTTGVDYVQIMEALETNGRTVLDAAAADVGAVDPEIVVRTELDLADPRTLLLEKSDEAAMVVVGSRGRGPFVSAVLGSVSAAVARAARCPVVVVRPGHDGSTHSFTRLHDGVLVAVDGTDRALAAVEFAFLQASQHSMPLTAIHCFPDLPSAGRGGRPVEPDEPGFEDLWLLLSEALGGMREKYPDVAVTQRLMGGTTGDCLSVAATRMNLVVLGAHDRHFLPVFFTGRTDIDVLEHSGSVVAIVPTSA